MITFAWHVTGMNAEPYPVLWLGDIPNEKHSPAAAMARQTHVLTGADEDAVWALPDSVSRVDYLSAKYPYNDPDPVDTSPAVVIVTEVSGITIEEV